MALLTHSLNLRRVRIIYIKSRNEWIGKLIPRRCMVAPTVSILSGLSIPVLMMLSFLPVTTPLILVSLTLVATGGIIALILCGEIL
jgi:hypothetical protein